MNLNGRTACRQVDTQSMDDTQSMCCFHTIHGMSKAAYDIPLRVGLGVLSRASVRQSNKEAVSWHGGSPCCYQPFLASVEIFSGSHV
jgi:hypothetical protein